MRDDALSLSFSAPLASPEPEAQAAPPAVYLVGRAAGEAAAWLQHPEVREAGAVLVEPGHWSETSLPDPGLVLLVPDDLGTGELLETLDLLARGRGEWIPALLQAEEGRAVVRPLSLGYRHPLSEAVEVNRDPAAGPVLLELRRVVARISVARHDINNPLTSALAETQLLLMDAPEGEVRAGLETVQRQLRRIRDMVQATSGMRLKDA